METTQNSGKRSSSVQREDADVKDYARQTDGRTINEHLEERRTDDGDTL